MNPETATRVLLIVGTIVIMVMGCVAVTIGTSRVSVEVTPHLVCPHCQQGIRVVGEKP